MPDNLPNYFLVMGLPRSRTNWLSHLFTTKNTFCFHDLSGYTATPIIMASYLAQVNASVVGNSDSGQVMVLDKLLRHLPRKPRLVYIRRPLEESIESFTKVTELPRDIVHKTLQQVDDTLDIAEIEYPGFSVAFDSLDNESVVRNLWAYATQGLPFPEEHYRGIRGKNIQIDPEQFRQRIHAELPNALQGAL